MSLEDTRGRRYYLLVLRDSVMCDFLKIRLKMMTHMALPASFAIYSYVNVVHIYTKLYPNFKL